MESEERNEYLQEYHRLWDQSINFVKDEITGEYCQKVNVILGIVTKPING